ncbi:MAG: hypothetical protein LKI25_06135 [Atopobiaceae bacterium]|jgi:hypothetical protein|nr:hypothetical protein [Atopobiaceae bacterium]MCI2173776.1 hypothetical protein [Atopobiaceae bacterium]MCI2207582.1 hypothetical protein [Atopobiaceae bacterium]
MADAPVNPMTDQPDTPDNPMTEQAGASVTPTSGAPVPPGIVDAASETAGVGAEVLSTGERVGYFFLGLLLFLIGAIITIVITKKRPEKARKQARIMAALGMLAQAAIYIIYWIWESQQVRFGF